MTKTETIFKKNLIGLRQKRNITPYRVAKDTGISLPYYYRTENPAITQRPDFLYLERLAEQKLNRLYDLLERLDNEHDTETAAALKEAIFILERISC